MKDQKETLLSWLNDAYSMEKGQIQVLENHVKDAQDHPEVHRKLAEHLELTRRHADMVEQCVARLGGSTSSVKTAMGTVAGFFQGRSTGAAPDEMVKNALSDYAAEHFEIACYRALITGARAVGMAEIAQVCEQILRDEEDMARWLESRLPMVVQMYLGQEVAAGSGGMLGGNRGTTGGSNRF
jgi:ferritin-like metal-binding protein YciE